MKVYHKRDKKLEGILNILKDKEFFADFFPGEET